MPQFLLMRHGQADFGPPRSWNTSGWGADLAPLTEAGALQVAARVAEIREWGPQIILASPMTRALQSAAIVAAALQLAPLVEFELHEWVPDMSFRWRTLAEVLEHQDELQRCGGEWPSGEKRLWEPVSSIRSRVMAVLQRYSHIPRVLTVCHGMVMYSLTGRWEIENAELMEYSLPA